MTTYWLVILVFFLVCGLAYYGERRRG